MRSTSCAFAGPALTAVCECELHTLVPTYDLLHHILVALAQAYRLLDGDLIKWVHRVLHILIDALAVRRDADLDRCASVTS